MKIKTIIISLLVLTFFVGGIGTTYALTSPGGSEVVGSTVTAKLGPSLGATFSGNNVFVSIASGMVREFTPAGAAVQDIDCSSVGGASFTTGSVFDDNMNFYVTMFDGGTVCKTDMDNTVHTSFGSGYSGFPESILIDAAGNFYVGAVVGDNDIRKFNSAGTPLGQFDVAIENVGSDWIDLAADQCTMFYTSEGVRIFRYDVCNDVQLTDFTTLPGNGQAFALRILPDGGVLVAYDDVIHRTNAAGAVIDTYDVTGAGRWFALNLDGDGTSFWSADFDGLVCRFDIATGGGVDNELICWNTGTGTTTTFGLSVKGEVTEARCPPGTVGTPPNCIPIDAIGGNIIPLDSTMVLAAGAQYTAAWMIPVIVSGIGIAIVIARKF